MQMTNQTCTLCGCELEASLVSKFNSNYCIYCQNQNSGSLETSDFVYGRNVLVKDYFMKVHKMDEASATAAAEAIIRENPLIIRKVNCKPCTLGACSIDYESKLKNLAPSKSDGHLR
jgi:hypothetical protein